MLQSLRKEDAARLDSPSYIAEKVRERQADGLDIDILYTLTLSVFFDGPKETNEVKSTCGKKNVAMRECIG